MDEWARTDRREITYTGPVSCGAPALMTLLHQAMSEWRELSDLPPDITVLPNGVVVDATGGLLSIRIFVDERVSDEGEESGGG